ncbi:hypothetical protein VQ056_07170 [Paenibacillus sp. JTLBN-2024]
MKRGADTVTVPAAVLEQLKAAADGAAPGRQICLQLAAVDASAVQQLLSKAGAKSGAQLAKQSEWYDLKLLLIDGSGKNDEGAVVVSSGFASEPQNPRPGKTEHDGDVSGVGRRRLGMDRRRLECRGNPNGRHSEARHVCGFGMAEGICRSACRPLGV